MATPTSLDIRRIPLKKLKPWIRNPRSIDEHALAGLAKSIETFGLVEPVIWNERTGHVVGGHQRLKVLQQQGATETDCVVVDLPQEREAALNLALNNPAIAGIFTDEASTILAELRGSDPGLVVDLLLDAVTAGLQLDQLQVNFDLGDGQIQAKDPMVKIALMVPTSASKKATAELRVYAQSVGGVLLE